VSSATNRNPLRDPFAVLGVPRDADEATVRARYLALIKKYPPERDPDRFREICAAFEAAKDPLSIARWLTQEPSQDPPRWEAAIEAASLQPPRMTVEFLLSLGNRAPQKGAPGESAPRDRTQGDRGAMVRIDQAHLPENSGDSAVAPRDDDRTSAEQAPEIA
jgi:hypothetical protein